MKVRNLIIEEKKRLG